MFFGHRVGILGGGQLARMLILRGHQLGLEMHVMCENAVEPAAQVTANVHIGNPQNHRDLVSFFKKVDLVTFESEFYDGLGLRKVEEETSTPLFPNAKAMGILQDRLSQKELLENCGVPTAPFMAIHNLEDLHEASAHFGKFVLKKRFGGYDGNGTFIIDKAFKSIDELGQKFSGLNVCQEKFIAEAYIPFKRELAVILVRNRNGEAIHLPLVETKQSQNRCDWVYGPIDHAGKNSLLKKLFFLLEEIDYVGAIGFEIFENGNKLLINEVAPRVHNSGHYSQEALSEDQFTLHLKSILNFPLARPKLLSKNFVMANLIGTNSAVPIIPSNLTGHLHWYGKVKNRSGRKMGHVNYVGSGRGLLNKAIEERKKIRGL